MDSSGLRKMATGRGISFRSVRGTDVRKEYEPLRRPGENSSIGTLIGHESLRQPGKSSNRKGFEFVLKQDENSVKVSQSVKHCDLSGDHSLDFISKQLYEFDGKDSEKLSQLVAALKFACATEEQLQNLVNIIYRYSLEGKLNAHIGALICHHLENFKINNTKFRNVLLKLLQKDYEDRKLVYIHLDKFIMNITFLCEVEHHMRLNGNRYALFDEPIINYFIMLVDGGSEKEVEAFVEQVRKCGKDLQASKPECFENLLVKVRKKVVSESSLSSSLRALLLETLEKVLIKWEPITSSAQKFYDLMSKPIITFCE